MSQCHVLCFKTDAARNIDVELASWCIVNLLTTTKDEEGKLIYQHIICCVVVLVS